jgi:hypothetical protein
MHYWGDQIEDNETNLVYVQEKRKMQIKSRAKSLTETHRLGDIGVDESVILKSFTENRV